MKLTKEKAEALRMKVEGVLTKHEQGFTYEEMKALSTKVRKEYPDFNMEKYVEAFEGVTYAVVEDKSIFYPWDVLTALRCGVENKDITVCQSEE